MVWNLAIVATARSQTKWITTTKSDSSRLVCSVRMFDFHHNKWLQAKQHFHSTKPRLENFSSEGVVNLKMETLAVALRRCYLYLRSHKIPFDFFPRECMTPNSYVGCFNALAYLQNWEHLNSWVKVRCPEFSSWYFLWKWSGRWVCFTVWFEAVF